MKLRFQVLNEFKVPLPLSRASDFLVEFSGYGEGKLAKSAISIVDAERGIGEVSLSSFELAGFRLGKAHSFSLSFKQDGKRYRVLFSNQLHIVEDENGGRFLK